jgi:hypothetical protein
MSCATVQQNNNLAFLKAFKSFFNVCHNVRIVLVGKKDQSNIPYNSEQYQMNTPMYDEFGYSSSNQVALLQSACSDMGKIFNQQILKVCSKHHDKVERSMRGHVMFDQIFRNREYIGVMGNIDEFQYLLHKLSSSNVRTHDGFYYNNNIQIDQGVFAHVKDEPNLYLLKGHPTIYLRTEIKKGDRCGSYNTFNTLNFRFYLDMYNVEIYKL